MWEVNAQYGARLTQPRLKRGEKKHEGKITLCPWESSQQCPPTVLWPPPGVHTEFSKGGAEQLVSDVVRNEEAIAVGGARVGNVVRHEGGRGRGAGAGSLTVGTGGQGHGEGGR